jgi:Ser/Thr protein kinase RdoA (MazF antagonist)/uncharacterized protein YkwD
MKNKKILLALVLIFTLLATQASSAQVASPKIADEDIPDAIETIQLINEFRAGKGLYPLTFNPNLANSAQYFAEYMAANNILFIDHKGPTEETEKSRDRAKLYGYVDDYPAGFENYQTSEIAYLGTRASPEASMNFWENSVPHYNVMVSTRYHEIGAGIAHSSEGRHYFVVNVGSISGATSPGATGYPGPSVDEYKSAFQEISTEESIPVITATEGPEGDIYHEYSSGETLPAIAVAYGIPLERLLKYNALSLDDKPQDGDLLLIKLPVATPTPTFTSTPRPTATRVPTNTPEPEETTIVTGEIVPTSTSVIIEDSSGGNDLGWLWILLAVVLIAAAAAGIYWYLPTLRKSITEDGFDLEAWLNEGLTDEDGPVDEDVLEQISSTAEFDLLPRQHQVTLLKDVALRALKAYPLEVTEIELLRYILNAEFLVHARPDSNPETVKKYVLRVNAPNFNARAEINSEMEWLDAIVNDTKLIVPIPVKTSSGNWVQTVDHPALGIFRHCVLFEYLPAAAVEDTITPQRMEFLGAMIGLIHRHGARFNPPPGFIRKHWDLEGMRGEMLDVPITQALAALSDEEREVLKLAEKIVAEAMLKLGTSPKVYGLIHGDLHLKSLLFSTTGKPVVIDFDTCGYGYYAYDLAVAIWNIFDRDDFADMRAALMRGYRKVRALSDLEESLITNFVAGRLMIQILTWAPRRLISTLNETADKAIDRQIAQLKALIKLFNK